MPLVGAGGSLTGTGKGCDSGSRNADGNGSWSVRATGSVADGRNAANGPLKVSNFCCARFHTGAIHRLLAKELDVALFLSWVVFIGCLLPFWTRHMTCLSGCIAGLFGGDPFTLRGICGMGDRALGSVLIGLPNTLLCSTCFLYSQRIHGGTGESTGGGGLRFLMIFEDTLWPLASRNLVHGVLGSGVALHFVIFLSTAVKGAYGMPVLSLTFALHTLFVPRCTRLCTRTCYPSQRVGQWVAVQTLLLRGVQLK